MLGIRPVTAGSKITGIAVLPAICGCANRLRIGKICQFHLRVTQIEATELFFIISVILLTINYQKTVSDKLSLASYSMRKIWVIYSSVYFNYKRQFSTKIFLWVRMTISGSY